MSHAEVFERIYASGAWGRGSGSGSVPALAVPYTRFVERYLRRHQIARVLDLGCGDGYLASAIDWGSASYTGIDVVRTGNFLARPFHGHMTEGDIRTCEWPAADLVLVKDVLQHWPVADIQALRPRLAAYPHVLITNQAAGPRLNADIEAGQVRPVDLRQPPFCWPVREVCRWLGDEVKSTVSLRQLG